VARPWAKTAEKDGFRGLARSSQSASGEVIVHG
jgi:hypothetical protein